MEKYAFRLSIVLSLWFDYSDECVLKVYMPVNKSTRLILWECIPCNCFALVFSHSLIPTLQIFNGVFLKVNKATLNMLHRVEPYVTYGYVSLASPFFFIF